MGEETDRHECISVRMPAELVDRVAAAARAELISKSDYVRRLLHAVTKPGRAAHD